MASKIKVDQIQTGDGTGTIALQNQLSGMTHASVPVLTTSHLPALTHAQMPSGSVIQVVGTKNGTQFSSSSTSYVEMTHLRLAITTLSANSNILVIMNCAKQGNQSQNSVVATEIRSSLDNYSASLLSNASAFYSSWNQNQGTDIVLHSAGQAAGTTITYRMYAKVNTGSFYAPDLWGVGGHQNSTVIQEIKG